MITALTSGGGFISVILGVAASVFIGWAMGIFAKDGLNLKNWWLYAACALFRFTIIIGLIVELVIFFRQRKNGTFFPKLKGFEAYASDPNAQNVQEPDQTIASVQNPFESQQVSAPPAASEEPVQEASADETQPTGSICKNCGADVPEGSKFCPECGAPVVEEPAEEPAPAAPGTCPNCGEIIPENSKFCPNCGTPVA
ncbi:MAG: zinc-ribbon domain-containing protein [Oscillospiraceae bacterium]|nr:zinc-ribbon domain-containing protein [Oscillospiraceae bacterium]